MPQHNVHIGDYQLVILGGGAAGLMLASMLHDRNSTAIIEGNDAPGAKLLVSGGGRCNITNAQMGPEHYDGDPAFIEAVLNAFDNTDLLQWLTARRLRPFIEKKTQYFCAGTARTLWKMFQHEIRGTALLLSHRIEKVTRQDGWFHVRTHRGILRAKKLVVATGGASFAQLGSSDIGHRIAKAFGHRITPPSPALVGLTLQPEQFFFKTLSGIATEVVMQVGAHRIAGRLLFAHRGISGPAVLDASLRWRRGTITIDFLPGFDWNRLQKSPQKIATLLPVPRRMAETFLAQWDLNNMPAKTLKHDAIERLRHLAAYRFAPAGTFGYGRAEVTRGGVSTGAIDPHTMESRRVPGLYIVGEALDVTGELGGYNLQWAMSSAAVCARALNGLME